MSELDDVIAHLYEASLDDASWEAALSGIAAATNSAAVQLIVADSKSGLPIFNLINEGWEEPAREYVDHCVSIDERVPRMLQLPHAIPVIHEKLYRGDEQAGSIVYNEFLSRYDAQSQCIVRMDGGEGLSVLVALLRSRRIGPHQGELLRVYEHLLPHLLRVVRMRHALVTTNNLHTPLASLLDSRQLGVVFLGRQREVLECNETAAKLLRESRGLVIRNRCLAAARPADERTLRRLLNEVIGLSTTARTDTRSSFRAPVVLRGAPNLMVTAAPIVSKLLDFGAHRAVAVVILHDRELKRCIDPESLHALYGLTRAQSNVAVCLAKGMPLPKIAQTLNIEVETVRKHLQVVMEKTYTHRQAELVALLSTGLA